MVGRSANGVSAPLIAMPTVCAAGAGMLAAWIAAGSVGVLADPLRIALTWLALAVSVVAVWPWERRQRLLLAAIVALAALPLVVPVTPMHDLLVVLALVALLAAGQKGLDRTVLFICAESVLVLVIFRLACVSIPIVWTLSDAVGAMLGRWAAMIAGRPLNVGATFGGLDYLVLMSAFCGLWLWHTRPPRRVRGACVVAAIVVGHVVYLVVLAFALDISGLLPAAPEAKFGHPYVPPDWSWSVAVKGLLPWNLPAIAAVFHLVTAALMLRWAPWRPAGDSLYCSANDTLADAEPSRWRRWSADYAALGLAVLLPIAGTLSLGPCDLSGKTIVASGHDQLDWRIPQHDRYGQQSAGTFGMLPVLVNSLDGQFRIAPELSDQELADADVVLLLHPAGPVPPEQRQRLLDFVRSGGSLLVAAGPCMRVGQLTGSFNKVLQMTGMSVRQDVAVSKTGNWQHALDVLAHPVTTGTDGRDDCNISDSGASIDIVWPARPLVVGRWGWSDPGSDAAMTSVSRFERGERLGDLVLAAQQPYGNGTIMVLGDSSRLTNEGDVRGYTLTGRILSHLANRRSSPSDVLATAPHPIDVRGIASTVRLASLPSTLDRNRGSCRRLTGRLSHNQSACHTCGPQWPIACSQPRQLDSACGLHRRLTRGTLQQRRLGFRLHQRTGAHTDAERLPDTVHVRTDPRTTRTSGRLRLHCTRASVLGSRTNRTARLCSEWGSSHLHGGSGGGVRK